MTDARTEALLKTLGLNAGEVAANFFSIGDIVTLKSGGPEMTVCFSDEDGYEVATEWFNGGELQHATFHYLQLDMN